MTLSIRELDALQHQISQLYLAGDMTRAEYRRAILDLHDQALGPGQVCRCLTCSTRAAEGGDR